jgi:type I restriction enzyme, S subunit
MSKRINQPNIRFKNSDTEWRTWKIGDVLTEKYRPILIEDEKEYQLVTVKRRNEGVILRGYLKGKNILVKNYFEVEEGDFIISKRQIIHGASGIVPKSLHKAVVSNEYLVAASNEDISSEYLTLISKLPDMHKMFFLSSYGVDIEKMVFDVRDWKKRSVIIPGLEEQKKIQHFFENVDQLLNCHAKEVEKLKIFKRAMLRGMFPIEGDCIPILRFKGFTKSWQEKELGDILNYERPDNYIVKSKEYSIQYKTPVLTANKGFILGYTNEVNTYNGPCIIFDDFTLDCKLVEFPFMVKSSALKILTIKEPQLDDLRFVFHRLITKKIEKMGHARHYIGIVQKTKVMVPHIDEQIKIGNYFYNLEKLISLHKKEINKLVNVKKACFQIMISTASKHAL